MEILDSLNNSKQVNSMNNNQYYYFDNKEEIKDIGGGLKRQMLGHNHELMAVKIWFDKGVDAGLHSHHHSQVSYVVKGEFHVHIDGNVTILNAGDSFFVPPHAIHGASCPTGGILIDTFSPPRIEFLEITA